MKQQSSVGVGPIIKLPHPIQFTNQHLFVGIDVHKLRWQVAVADQDILLSNTNIASGIDTLMHHLNKKYPGAHFHCAYEISTFGFGLYRNIIQQGHSCIVVNPADIPDTDKDRRSKRDSTDARKLADNLRAARLRPIHIPTEKELKHRSLIRFRKKLWSDLVRAKNRLRSELVFQAIMIPAAYDKPHWSHNFLNWIEQQAHKDPELRETILLMLEEVKALRLLLLKTERKLREMMWSPGYKAKSELLRSIPGIGPLTAMLILLEIGDIKRFVSFDHLNSYVGLCPDTHQSAESSKPRGITTRRHNQLRSAIVESAWQLIRRDPAMLQYYKNLCLRMKGQDAIIRIARRLLRRIRAVLISGKRYALGIDGPVLAKDIMHPDPLPPKKKGRPAKTTSTAHCLL
jgi:transposase